MVEQLVVEPREKTPGDTALFLQLFPTDPECEARELTKTTQGQSVEEPHVEARGHRAHLSPTFGDALTVDHKVLSEENESCSRHRYEVVAH